MFGSAPKSHNMFGQWIVVIQTCQCKHMLCLVRLVKSMVIISRDRWWFQSLAIMMIVNIKIRPICLEVQLASYENWFRLATVESSDASIFFCLHTLCLFNIPIGSMYGIFANIYPINDPNVGEYTIHGSYGIATAAIYIICDFLLICLVLKWWLSIATLSNLRVCTVSRFALSAVFTNYDYTLYMQRFDPEKTQDVAQPPCVGKSKHSSWLFKYHVSGFTFNFTNLGCFFCHIQ